MITREAIRIISLIILALMCLIGWGIVILRYEVGENNILDTLFCIATFGLIIGGLLYGLGAI